ncbi:MAG: ComF family protein [Motiliproteus sp.]|nr:ComF family protein [Motiliproteus sp.]MCW9050785.1 ComF family protein [Motiliproteus sp.]
MIISSVNNWLLFNRFKIPRQCLLCQQITSGRELICCNCHSDLPWLQHCCYCCAEPLKASASNAAPNLKRYCGRCLKKTPYFERTLSPLLYQFPIDRLVAQLKHQAKPDLLQLSCDLFLQTFESQIRQQPPQQLIPVPLHRNRLYHRGYNQAAEWGRYLARNLDIQLNTSLCHRLLDTPHQQGLSAKQRRRNLAKAYQVGDCEGIHHVAILDDVMTTGTTIDLLARQLRRQGVTTVEAWTLARTPSHPVSPSR